ncbi:cytokine receptor-like factor 3 [Neocloeon triangulifer]|uniref:cytokine receptor-like factor 3 n=1 Tax=Neocloeon triangulifer TaxID=2078957 RepID=UPI00286F4BC4|nr:cytokine receptor-like factor 3 [Neocloeon triangulifer]
MEFDQSNIVEGADGQNAPIERIEELFSLLDLAESQVSSSADKAIKDINAFCDALSAAIEAAIETRKQALTAEVLKAKAEGIAGLKPYREAVGSRLGTINESDANICSALSRPGKRGRSKNTLRIPRKEELPHISVQLPGRALQTKVCNEIMAAGKVSSRGPVQLTFIEEKPGALLLNWEEVDQGRAVDFCQFRLQRAHGDACHNPSLEANFHDIYRGPDASFLAKELIPGDPYTFRVCSRAEGDQEWSAWSLPKVAITRLKHFGWQIDNPNYQVTNDNKIASKISSDPSVLYSCGAQFGPGHSIEFTVLEAKECMSDEGFGLASKKLAGDSLFQTGTLIVNGQGSIFVDGSAKTTKLPALTLGSKVTFTCEEVASDRMRVHIDSDNKTVTYDWRVPAQPLLFVLGFGQVGWKVLVE